MFNELPPFSTVIRSTNARYTLCRKCAALCLICVFVTAVSVGLELLNAYVCCLLQ